MPGSIQTSNGPTNKRCQALPWGHSCSDSSSPTWKPISHWQFALLLGVHEEKLLKAQDFAICSEGMLKMRVLRTDETWEKKGSRPARESARRAAPQGGITAPLPRPRGRGRGLSHPRGFATQLRQNGN